MRASMGDQDGREGAGARESTIRVLDAEKYKLFYKKTSVKRWKARMHLGDNTKVNVLTRVGGLLLLLSHDLISQKIQE